MSTRRRPSPALFVSTIALVVALGGSAVATSYVITSTKQIKPSVLKKLKGKRGPAGAAGSAGTDGAKGAAGAKGDTGATGAKGDAGTAGAAGATGTTGTTGNTGNTGPRGPSNVKLWPGTTVADFDNGSLTASPTPVLAGLPLLGPGSFLLHASMDLSNTGGAAATASCILFASGGIGSPIDTGSVTIPNGGKATLDLQGIYTITGSNVLLLSCVDGGGTVGSSTSTNVSVLTVESAA